MAPCFFMLFVEPSHSCVLFGAAIVTVTCAVCTIRGKNGHIQQVCLWEGIEKWRKLVI